MVEAGRRVAESSASPVSGVGRAGLVISANPSFCALCGVERAALPGASIRDLLRLGHGDPAAWAELAQALQGGQEQRSQLTGADALGRLRCIFESSLRMARTLALHTVAEGVETVEEWALLRDAGCQAAQGWLIGRPMPGPAIAGWLAQWHARRAALLPLGPG